MYVGTPHDIYTSNNNQDFTLNSSVPNQYSVNTIMVSPFRDIYFGTDHGVYYSDDGRQFIHVANFRTDNQFYVLNTKSLY